jgi:hypothetical protein
MRAKISSAQCATEFVSSADGSTAPIFAMSLMAIVSLVGATLALSMDSRAANSLQGAADSAAISGATAFINATSPRAEDRINEARQLAAATARSNTSYTLTQLDVSQVVEDAYGQHTEIVIDLSFEPVNPAARLVGRTANVAIKRTAAATATWGFPLCILALNEVGGGLETSGNTSLVADNCVIWTNSKRGDSMQFAGGSARTKYFCAAGNAAVSGASVTPNPHENCDPIPDPLVDWLPPSPGTPTAAPAEVRIAAPSALLQQTSLMASAFPNLVQSGGGSGSSNSGPGNANMTQAQAIAAAEDQMASSPLPIINEDGEFLTGPAADMTVEELLQVTGDLDNVDKDAYEDDQYKSSATLTMSPGTYAGLDISAGHVRFQPGVYHIVGAPLIVRRRATLSGQGVTIILHGDHATFSVLDEARLNLTAPETGVTAGFVLAENKALKLSNTTKPQRSRLTGSGMISAIGTVYLPRQQLSITGDGAADQASPLLQIVADRVDMADQGALKIIFDTSKTDVPVKILPERTARLVR